MDEMVLTRRQTPIEIALDIDETGHTTARKLYKWLELREGDYARWIKQNIIDNPYAENGVEYSALVRKTSEQGGRPSQDFLLSVSFAKKLAMACRSPKGEETRNYFINVEKALVAVVEKPQSPAEMLLRSVELLVEHEHKMAELEARQDSFSAYMDQMEEDRQAEMTECMNSQDYLAEELQVVRNALYVKDGGFIPMTVIGWKNANGIKMNLSEDSKLGKICTRLSKEKGLRISKVPVPGSVYGSVNAYEPYIIREAYKEFCRTSGRKYDL